MPRISHFFGMDIYMYYSDHLPPHFHAEYGEYGAQIVIATGEVMQGVLPRRALALVREWLEERRGELMQDWELGRKEQPLKKIEPLE